MITNENETQLGGSCLFCGVQHGEKHLKDCNMLSQEEVTSICYPSVNSIMNEYLESIIPEDIAPKEKLNKPDWSVFPFTEALEVLKVFEYGAEKYHAPFTYRRGTGVPEHDLWSASLRHLIELQNGNQLDPESNCLHWAHIAANALMAIATLQRK